MSFWAWALPLSWPSRLVSRFGAVAAVGVGRDRPPADTALKLAAESPEARRLVRSRVFFSTRPPTSLREEDPTVPSPATAPAEVCAAAAIGEGASPGACAAGRTASARTPPEDSLRPREESPTAPSRSEEALRVIPMSSRTPPSSDISGSQSAEKMASSSKLTSATTQPRPGRRSVNRLRSFTSGSLRTSLGRVSEQAHFGQGRQPRSA